jgi:hypothetical protein
MKKQNTKRVFDARQIQPRPKSLSAYNKKEKEAFFIYIEDLKKGGIYDKMDIINGINVEYIDHWYKRHEKILEKYNEFI